VLAIGLGMACGARTDVGLRTTNRTHDFDGGPGESSSPDGSTNGNPPGEDSMPGNGNNPNPGTGGAPASGGNSVGGNIAVGGTAPVGGSAGAGGGTGECPGQGQVRDSNTDECICPFFKPDFCEASNQCTNLLESNEHCGVCDAPCTNNSACNQGSCTDPPVLVATLNGCISPRLILVDGVFYISDAGAGTIKSVTVAGATPVLLATGQDTPGAIAADEHSVYWSNQGDSSIRSTELTGGTVETLINLDAPARSIAVYSGQLYFSHAADIFKIPIAGAGVSAGTPDAITCTPEDVEAGRTPPPLGDAVPGAVYVASSNESCTAGGEIAALTVAGDRVLYAVDVRAGVEANSVSGGQYLELGESQGLLLNDQVMLSGNYGYWGATDHVQRASLDLGKYDQEQVIGTLDFDPLVSFTVIDTHAYILGEQGVIARKSLNALEEDAVPLVRDLPDARWLVHDDTDLYWIDSNCDIMAAPL
jgi:hypothetical protein